MLAAMRQRAASMLLIALVVLAGVARGPCPLGNCAMSARNMDCCARDGWTAPSCCDGAERAQAPAPPSAAIRAIDSLSHLAAEPAPAVLGAPALCLADALMRFAAAAVPPNTLIAQHTALLL